MIQTRVHPYVYADTSRSSLRSGEHPPTPSSSELPADAAQSQKFEILTATPSNYTTVTGMSSSFPSSASHHILEWACTDDGVDYPSATRTATLDHFPNPTQEWAITLDGSDPDVTATATASIVGNAGQ